MQKNQRETLIQNPVNFFLKPSPIDHRFPIYQFMAYFFVLTTLIINLTPFVLGFKVFGQHGRRILPELLPGGSRLTDLGPAQKLDRGSKIQVLLDGEFSGIELKPEVIVKNIRVVFRIDSNVLIVDGAPEIVCIKEMLYRHRYIGFMRKKNWNSRPDVFIARSDSESATILRNRKGDCQHLAPFVVATLENRSASPQNESPTIPKIQETELPPVQPARTTMGHPHPPGAPERSEDQMGASNVRPLSPTVKSEEQRGTSVQARLRDDESSAEPPKPSSCLQSRRITDYYLAKSIYDESLTETPKPSSQQARVTDDESPSEPPKSSSQQARLRDDVSLTTKSAKPSRRRCSGTATRQQARVRDDETLTSPRPQVRFGEQVGPWDVPRDRTNGVATHQQARRRDDEYMVGMDSFVGVVLLFFALAVIMWKKFFF